MGYVTSDEDDNLADWIATCVRLTCNRTASWRSQAKDSYDLFAGDQWSDQSKARNEQLGVPSVVFNKMVRTIGAVSGLQRQNRQEVSFSPRTLDKSAVAERVTAIVTWAREMSDGEDEDSEAFEDCLICGMGWTEITMDYEDDPEGLVKIDRIDPIEMGWDTSAKKRNLKDTQYRFRIKKMTKRDFYETWGTDYVPTEWDLGLDYDLNDEVHNLNLPDMYANHNHSVPDEGNMVRVVQFQWWDKETVYAITMPDGEVVLEKDDYKKVKSQIKQNSYDVEERKVKKYKQAFINGTNILEKTDLSTNGFSLIPLTGHRKRRDNTWFGLGVLMKDPQMFYNKWLAQIIYILNCNSKGGLYAETDAFDNPADAEDDFASPDAILMLKPGGIGKIQERQAAQMPQGYSQLLGIANDAIADIPGVNQEMLGVANRDQAGYLEMQRKQAGLTILATFFDSFRYYTKVQGRSILAFIREYMPDKRLVRVGSKEDAQYVPLIKDEMTETFDIVVDEAPSSPNMKDKVWGALQAIIPTLIQANIPVPQEILDYSPLPSQLVAAWKDKLNQPPQPNPVSQQTEALQLAQADATIKLTKAEAMKVEAESLLNQAKTLESKSKTIETLHKAHQAGTSSAMNELHILNNLKGVNTNVK